MFRLQAWGRLPVAALVLLLALAFGHTASAAPVAILAPSASVEENTGSTFTKTLSYTVPPGNNRLLVVTSSGAGNNETDISSVTWNGSGMTLAAKRANLYSGGANAGIWYVVLGSSANPITANVTVSYERAFFFEVTATAFSNVDQVTPVSGATTAQSASLAVASAPGHMVIDSIVGPGTTGTPAAGQTLVAVARDLVDNTQSAGASTAPGASSVTMSWSGIASVFSGTIAHAGVSITSTDPTVTSLSPFAGPTTGGTTVVITGTNLTGSTAVKFGATAAASFIVNSSTQITATSPAGAGTVDVRVTNAGITSATSAVDQFTYVPPPTITSILPTQGPATGGTSVVITGTNLTTAAAVTFGATAATTFTVDSATQITATSPAGTGTVDVRVTTVGGTSPTSASDQFTYVPAPTVTSLSPTAGPGAGGTVVTVSGTNFSNATAVSFGATPATSFTFNSPTSITATSPAGTGTVDLRVTTVGGTSATSAADQFTFIPAPVVTSISPTAGPTAGGTIVTITGTSFTGVTAVTFGGTAATSFTFNSATTITATAPAGTGTVDVRVTTPGGTSATSAADQYTYRELPAVTSLLPTAGPATGGTSVIITGSHLSGATAVTFGSTAATGFTVNSATQITATSPAGTGTVDVRVTTAGGTSATSAADQFTFVPAPTVTSLSPASGPTTSGTTVAISGTNFSGATAVTFGATSATGFTVNSATSITATAPAGTGTVDVRVTTLGGTSATSAAAQFTYVPVATVGSVSPLSGPTGGGTSVTISGTYFTGATAVKFGAANATSFTVNSSTSITATSPAGSGAADITVTTVGGTSATSAADVFTFTTASHFSVTAPGAATAGSAFGITVTALDSFNNVASGYIGTARLTKTDSGSGAAVPVDYTFTAGDHGAHTFANGVTLVTAGSQTVTATDAATSNITGTSASIAVSPGATTHFVVTAPGTALTGDPISITLTALDAFNNVTPAYLGTVAFTKSDSGAGSAVPANYTFLAGDSGVHTFTGGVTFVIQGPQTVTATDTLSSGVTGFATVNVGTLNPTVVQLVPTDPVTGLPLAPGSSYAVDRQSGTIEVRMSITNTTAFPLNGFRLSVNYSAYLAEQPSLRLYNSSSAPGVMPAYIDYPFPVAVGGTISLKLQFYTSTRLMPNPFNPTLAVTPLQASEVSSTDGSGVEPRIHPRPNGTILLEWDSVPGTWYRVKYSGDLTDWFDSPVPVQAVANRTQWLDDGAPFTNVSPATVPSRFYRVNVIAAPTP